MVVLKKNNIVLIMFTKSLGSKFYFPLRIHCNIVINLKPKVNNTDRSHCFYFYPVEQKYNSCQLSHCIYYFIFSLSVTLSNNFRNNMFRQ